MFNTVVITAGGSGKRLPGTVKKQYRELIGKPVLFHTIDKFINHPLISHLVITLPSDDIDVMGDMIRERYNSTYITICEGGVERQNSIYNALQSVPDSTDFVLIHDGVRPFVSKYLITSLINYAYANGAVIPATKAKYTMKEIRNNLVVKTIPRESLVEVHTPQIFPYKELIALYEKAIYSGVTFTDDASIYEYYNKTVNVMLTEEYNLKITNSLDLEVAELLVRENESEL